MLPLFFVLAFAFSAIVWWLLPAIDSSQVVLGLSGMVGSFGPALAAILVNTYVHRRNSLRPWKFPRPVAILAALIASGGVMGLVLAGVPASQFSPVLWVTVGLGVVFSSTVILSSIYNPDFPARLQWRAGWRQYALALAAFPVVALAGLAINRLMGQPLPDFPAKGTLQEILVGLFLAILTTLFYGGPLGEEPGWRGFALPRLLRWTNPLLATLLLGLLWSLWHTPLHLNGFYPGGPAGVIGRLAFNIPMAFLFTWIYQRTSGNLWMAVLTHTSVNVTTSFLPITVGIYIAGAVLILYIIISGRMWRKESGPFDKTLISLPAAGTTRTVHHTAGTDIPDSPRPPESAG